jgi:hypothetical protein
MLRNHAARLVKSRSHHVAPENPYATDRNNGRNIWWGDHTKQRFINREGQMSTVQEAGLNKASKDSESLAVAVGICSIFGDPAMPGLESGNESKLR